MDSKRVTMAIIVIAVVGCFFALCIIICTLCICVKSNHRENEIGGEVELGGRGRAGQITPELRK